MTDFIKVIRFEGLGLCFYERLGFRTPKQGEFYLSGAIVEAWQAPTDLSIAYNIVRPTHHAEPVYEYKRGARVTGHAP